ncbi:MAG: nucleotide exchange factor GrpE [Clostridiales bacterium]|nr:nucleotide exchange factor GrpE [Clostridiales bacterium]
MKRTKEQSNDKAETLYQESADSVEETESDLHSEDAQEQLQTLEEQLTQAQLKRDEYLNMAQRVQAEFDNFRRRNATVRSEAFEDGAAAFIKTILSVCDNLERALEVESTDEALTNGVKLVQKQLMDTLEKRGVSVIDRVGEPFDPKLEDAVTQGGPDEGEPGTVAQVLLKGYRMGDNILRHAMVKVIVG